MVRLSFDPSNPDLSLVRHAVLLRLRQDRGFAAIDYSGDGFSEYVDFRDPSSRQIFAVLAQEVFWALVVEGVLSPGRDYNDDKLPWFHITAYGGRVLRSAEPQPHDPDGYLRRMAERFPEADATVLAYLTEAVETFVKGRYVASGLMLGIAAERVFLLTCDAVASAIADPAERNEFETLLTRFPMKPKLNWVHRKIEALPKDVRAGMPENTGIMLMAVYDLLRLQRNELGHPRETPPQVGHEDAFVNLQVFPRFYETAERVRAFLAMNQI
jgi:hypothetical protein